MSDSFSIECLLLLLPSGTFDDDWSHQLHSALCLSSLFLGLLTVLLCREAADLCFSCFVLFSLFATILFV